MEARRLHTLHGVVGGDRDRGVSILAEDLLDLHLIGHLIPRALAMEQLNRLDDFIEGPGLYSGLAGLDLLRVAEQHIRNAERTQPVGVPFPPRTADRSVERFDDSFRRRDILG